MPRPTEPYESVEAITDSPVSDSTVSSHDLVREAFRRLAERSGFENRESQIQLSLLLCDLIEQGSRGLFEAPTGLGKSLAALIPAIACGIASQKRTVIATYTNVLAEQYWRKDLPLALSLFSDHCETAFLIGRQRYTCLEQLEEVLPKDRERFMLEAELGTETEFRRFIRKPDREVNKIWSQVAVPPVCPARACPAYQECFYYDARRKLEKAKVIITNHSVVIQDSLGADVETEREGMLFKYDYLILDEAHDFPSAAVNGLEFEISMPRLSALTGVARRLQNLGVSLAHSNADDREWNVLTDSFVKEVQSAAKDLAGMTSETHEGGIVAVSPPEVEDHPAVQKISASDRKPQVESVANRIQLACEKHAYAISNKLEIYRSGTTDARTTLDSTRNYLSFIRDFAAGAAELSNPSGSSVSYIGKQRDELLLRCDLIDLKVALQKLLWDRVPATCLSATLLVDQEFEFFERQVGFKADFREALPSPYHFAEQCALYLPPPGAIPDPTQSRNPEVEHFYYMAIAQQVTQIIEVLGGRTLVLFHSRKEMEQVRNYVRVGEDLPILMQGKTGIATVGEQFKKNPFASLFALRSFWTGFDAPGETCSCVVLVRIPFEVPTEPAVVARMAYLSQQGEDPFMNHTLPTAKMMMRQGAGRLIRSNNDKGVIALLDPRLRTKRYGEQILSNFPPEIRIFDDFADAAGSIGLG